LAKIPYFDASTLMAPNDMASNDNLNAISISTENYAKSSLLSA